MTLKDYSSYYSSYKDVVLSDGQRLFEMQLKDFEGYDVLINGVANRVIIQDHTNPLNEYKEDRKIMCLNNVPINRGDIIETTKDNRKYLIVTAIDENPIYQTAKMTECNHNLKWQDETLSIIESPCIIQNYSLYTDGVQDGKLIQKLDTKINITLPNTIDTKKIKRDKRFIVSESTYKVTMIDDYSRLGLISITATEDQTRTINDNFELGVADYIEPMPSPTPTDITISGSTTIVINQTNTYTTDYVGIVVYELRNDDGLSPTTMATITEQANNTCKVKAANVSANVGKWFRLYAISGLVENYIRIQVKSLF